MNANSLFLNQKQKFINEASDHEDRVVTDFLNALDKNREWRYLEVGSGLGRFPLKVKDIFSNLLIECIEINPDLAKITSDHGLRTSVGSAVLLPFSDQSFDILHCSHVIEHVKYPEIAELFNQLLRVTNNNGYVIIRSPLWHPDFYLDIDHVRPYPPESIINYFSNAQQQKVGYGNFKVIKCWYRRENFKLFNIGSSRLKYFINALLALSWTYIRFPFSKKNGYVIILQKIV